MQSLQSQPTEQWGQTLEHLEQTGRPQGPPGLCALPGHRFSAAGAHPGPEAKHASRIEKVLELLERSDPTWGLDVDRGPDLGTLLPLVDGGDLTALSPPLSGTGG